MRIFLVLVCPLLLSLAWACQPAQELRVSGRGQLGQLAVAHEMADPAALDYALLAEVIFHETNERREEHGVGRLQHLTALDRAACVHAEAMVEQDFFAHANPTRAEVGSPADRVRQQGLEIGFVAENIGEVFVLQYESGETVYIRQESGGTVFSEEPGGEPLAKRSYLEVAKALLDSWMASPGHRRNILATEPDYFGSGCQLSAQGDPPMSMLSCVQLFFSPAGGQLR